MFTGPYKLVTVEGVGYFLHREKSEEFHKNLIKFLCGLSQTYQSESTSRKRPHKFS